MCHKCRVFCTTTIILDNAVEQHCRHYKIVFLSIKEEIHGVAPVKATVGSQKNLSRFISAAVLLLPVADVQISPGIVLIIRHNGTSYSLKKATFRTREHCLRSLVSSLLSSLDSKFFFWKLITITKCQIDGK